MHARILALIFTTLFALSGLADQVALNVGLANTVLEADATQTTYLKVGLTGFRMPSGKDRPPVNVAIVLDKSGSMSGAKIQRAREAAIAALERLDERDIVSVVTYDNSARVVVPATKMSDRADIIESIRAIQSGGSTALFAGVSKGAAELRKFLAKDRVNRVILLSDGLANVGPSSPGELADLGRSFGKEGIAVTTIGLGTGYNEDLMAQLAANSDGTHAFAESASDLNRMFAAEFGDITSVVAQEVAITIRCKKGVRPVQVLGRKAEINGRTVIAQFNQIYSQQQKYVLLEIEVAPGAENSTRDLAEVSVSYANMATNTTDTLTNTIGARFSKLENELVASVDRDVMVSCVSQIANDNAKRAVALRDEGKVEEARELFLQNADYLNDNAATWTAPELQTYGEQQIKTSRNLQDSAWGSSRKDVRSYNNFIDQQQTFR
jgi:Ca-activated chloride channel family protein